jgi:hypothetical protein
LLDVTVAQQQGEQVSVIIKVLIAFMLLNQYLVKRQWEEK